MEHVHKIYILHVGKTRRWSDRIISARTNECIRVTVSLLALDIPVNRHQALLHQAGFLSQCHSFLSPEDELSGTTIIVLRLRFCLTIELNSAPFEHDAVDMHFQ